MTFRTVSSLLALTVGLASVPAFAQSAAETPSEASQTRYLDTISVVGVAGGESNIGGSVDFISAADLEKQGHGDILRILRVVPGVNIQEEEGYGLRPNIGLRGSGSDRNSRIMIMEDGVPVAPAVYASPSAYYFPGTTRIHSVEVVKGPSVIQYGPRTTGGAIHLFSTPIPEETAGYAEVLAGDFGRQRLHAYAGTRDELTSGLDFGLLVETYQDEADGFLERDTVGPDTGFDIEDYVVKAALFADEAAMPWSLEFKYQAKDEVSNQTYLGLTEDDFDADAYRLYDAARNDQMVNENEFLQLTGTIDISDKTNLTVIAYSNEVSRNWYKLHGINAAGGGASGDVGLSSILADPATYADEIALIRGTTSLDDSLVVRANNRSYYSRGLSATLDTELDLGGFTHNLNVGVRFHGDEEDRFQKEDAYRLENGELFLTTSGPAGGTTNRVTQGEALSFFVLNRVELTERFQITGGFRIEDYDVTRDDFSTADPSRTNGPTRTRSAGNTEILPSISAIYALNDEVDLIGGIHKGYSPTGATTGDAESEESWQYEAGARFNRGQLSLEGIAFFNDYSNLLGECTNSSGGDCDPGDAFNGDAVDVYGLELTAEWDAAEAMGISGYQVPLTLAYSWTDTEFQTSFASDFFGSVTEGDELVYVPEQQFTLSGGVIGDRWGVNTVLNYVGESRSEPGQGSIPDNELIDSRTLVDVSAFFELTDSIRLKAKAENLFDETYLAARRPSGLRPGKPQEFLVGFEFSF